MSRGACKICSNPLSKEINKRLAADQPAPQIVQWLETKGFGVTRQTIYNHKTHITDPKQTFVEAARKNPVIKNVSNDDFLRAVVDAAAARIETDPESVTIEQGLKAANIREARRDKGGNIFLVLAELVTRRDPIEVIEGEYREVLGEAPKEITTA